MTQKGGQAGAGHGAQTYRERLGFHGDGIHVQFVLFQKCPYRLPLAVKGGCGWEKVHKVVHEVLEVTSLAHDRARPGNSFVLPLDFLN